MIRELNDFIVHHPISFPLLLIIFFFAALVVSALCGNITGMRILIRLRIPIFSGRLKKDFKALHSINKDVIGWLKVPGVCYAPVMQDNQGQYLKMNYLREESEDGELYLSENVSSKNLSSIAKETNNQFHDLSIIVGSAMVRHRRQRDSQFTYIPRYIRAERTKDVVLFDGRKERFYELLFVVDMGLEHTKEIKFKSREEFLKSMRKIAVVDTGKDIKNNILILKASTNIDNTLVFLVEK